MKERISKGAIAIIGLLLLYNPSGLPALSQSTFNPSELNPTLSTETAYTLGPGDRIRVNVYQVPDFSGEFLILPDGTITLPLLGLLKIQGLTVNALSNNLSQRYAQYLKRPIVTVSVLSPRPLQLAIAGEINSPGTYTLPVSDGQKYPLVTDLIRQAGGITTVADIRRVELRRKVGDQEKVWNLNLWEVLQNANLGQDASLRDGDTIFIPTKTSVDIAETRQLAVANFGIQSTQDINVTVVGEINRPGAYRINPNLATGTAATSNNTGKIQPPRLTLALRTAGGIKPLADIRNITITRFNRDGTQQNINVDLWSLVQTGNIEEDIILQEGDSISIPTATDIPPDDVRTLATASFAPNSIRVNVVGEVIKPGTVEVPPNTPLNQALLTAGGFDKRRARESIVDLIRLNPNGTVSKYSLNVDFSNNISQNNPTLQDNDVIIVNRNTLTQVTDTINTIVSPIGTLLGLSNFVDIFRGN